MAAVVRVQQPSIHISKCITWDGTEVTDDPDILQSLLDFYYDSYSSRGIGDEHALDNRLPIEFYKQYKDILLPQLLHVFREALIAGRLPLSMREAIIVLILKPGKDPTSPGSYRRISLLMADIKLLVKVLANRLSKIVSEVIIEDQSGFMPNKSTAIDLRRLFLNLQLSSPYWLSGSFIVRCGQSFCGVEISLGDYA